MARDHIDDGRPRIGDDGNTYREADRLKAAAEREQREAGEAVHDAADAAKQKARELGAEAKDEAARRVAAAQKETSESLHAFAEAIRAAGDDLARKDQGTAATLVREAASGLERMSTAFGRKGLHDIVDDVRAFGRHNPNAFVAGSVLVGLALGRFAQSGTSETQHSRGATTARETSDSSGAFASAGQKSSGG